jgi:16S rRNA (guanine1207-N2)-methyltransferase
MSVLTTTSEVILRHSDKFINRRVLFAGDLQDTLPALLAAIEVRVFTQQYHHWQLLNQAIGNNAQFNLTLDAAFVDECDTLIYYWPKSKQEAQFQLCNILALLPVGADVFVVGKNRSGVRSAEQTVLGHATLMKIDSARCCSLYYGRVNVQTKFNLTDWWQSYLLHDLAVKTLPGVFSRDRLDTGSALLLSTLENSMQGKVLDVGCGAGVVAAMLSKLSSKVKLTLSDVSAAAIDSSRATLAANSIKGEVIVSNVYSNITGCFDMIISNPPFHDGLLTRMTAAETLIRGALKHLPLGGRLRIVANSFLPYQGMLDTTFGNHEVLAQNDRFKVYQATVRLPPRDLKKRKKFLTSVSS